MAPPSSSYDYAAAVASSSAAASSSPPLRQPDTPPLPLSERTSSRDVLRHSYAHDAGSPPSTPSPQARRVRSQKPQEQQHKGKQPLRPSGSRDIAQATSHAIPKVSHELSFSPATRDSLVDNLLFSLDSLSRVDDGASDDAQRPDEVDWQQYTFPHAMPALPTSLSDPRLLGHAYNSSISSDMERHAASGSRSADPMSSRTNRSISVLLGRDSGKRIMSSSAVDTVSRSSVDTFTSGANGTVTPRNALPHSVEREISAASLDRSRPAWKRRSVSVDQLFAEAGAASILDRGRPVPSIYSMYDASARAAPQPGIANGPRALLQPNATGPVYIDRAQPRMALRKTTTQSDLRTASAAASPPIPQDIRDKADDFVRVSVMRAEPRLQTPVDRADAARSPSLQQASSQKNLRSTGREKPSFLRRVFRSASSRASAETPKSSDSADVGTQPAMSLDTDSQADISIMSRDQPVTQAVPPVSLSKKPSSFFRRRKKSISDPVPMPIPQLPAGRSPDVPVARTKTRSGSVSSLRKVMDPYLDGASDPRIVDVSRPNTQQSSTEKSDSPDIFHAGYTPPPDKSLALPHATDMSSIIEKPASSSEVGGSPKMKLKLKKRPSDAVHPAADDASDTAAVGALQLRSDDKENLQPLSRISTGDRIIAAAGGLREVDDPSPTADDPSTITLAVTRLAAKKPERLLLGISASQQRWSQDTAQRSQQSEDTAMVTPVTASTQYHSATSLPLAAPKADRSASLQSNEPAAARDTPQEHLNDGAEYSERARKIFAGDEEDVGKLQAASWLGENSTLSTRTRTAYMALFDFSGINVLAALRILCGRLALRGETQQFDRIITALSERWCECNPNHGFKAQDVVHTIVYSLILLNTDLHMADISEKMSRSAYVKNTLPTIRRVVSDAAPGAFDNTLRPSATSARPTLPWSDSSHSLRGPSEGTSLASPSERGSFEIGRSAHSVRASARPGFYRGDSDGPDNVSQDALNALVNQPFTGSIRSWEAEVEAILKAFFLSIKTEPLPLHRSLGDQPNDRGNSMLGLAPTLKRSGSVISKTTSDGLSFRTKPGLRNMTAGLQSKYSRSRPRPYPPSTLGSSSRTSFDDGTSMWSPAQSNLSKYSVSKTLTSASMHSLGQHSAHPGDFKHSIGFANALSQAIIREEAAGNRDSAADSESVSISVPNGLLDDDDLALEGAPWAKEGLVKHKHHMEADGKRAKERSWTDCFAVISSGRLTLFNFNTSKSQSLGRKALSRPSTSSGKGSGVAAPRVGGGDWMENAEQLDVFVLRQTIASTLPSPGYSKTRPHVWVLSLPSGAVHMFNVGTPEIAREFMTTANYWSARLSKEPLVGAVSNIEYGWSDDVINTALLERSPASDNNLLHHAARGPPPAALQTQAQARVAVGHAHTNSAASRPSFQSSVRTSLDAGFAAARPAARLPGDKIALAEWHPPSQSLMASQLMEVDQLRALSGYVAQQEAELEAHNELKHAIELAYTPRHANATRAMANWQRKSDYLLREIVKFRTYTDSLAAAQQAKAAVYARKAERDGRDMTGSPEPTAATTATA